MAEEVKPENKQTQLEKIKEALVDMDRIDRAALMVIYRWMHDALKCRV